MGLLSQAAIFLCAAVVAVPISKRLGLGSVLGYLVAGAAIGPWGLRLISGVDNILHAAEFGVVLLLFVIGLELQPNRLWTMRKPVFGLGLLQVAITAAVLGAAAAALGVGWRAAVVIGLGLSLSSTAFALQTLAEKGQLTTRHGRAAFAVLLFQDLAAIPMLALLPLLGGASGERMQTPLASAALAIAAIALVVIGGRWLLDRMLRVVAGSRIRELFTAFALLTVIATALLMDNFGLSMALGAFIAGVVLADSEFRHALEADIEPFKGLLLGLFFIAVGMSVNFGLLAESPFVVVGLVLAMVSIKTAILLGLGRAYGLGSSASLRLAATVSQGGEFAFVIFNLTVGAGVLDSTLSELLIVTVTISMAMTPVLMVAAERLLQADGAAPAPEPMPAIEEDNRVIIAGFGRVGQIVGRVLRAKKIGFTALEISPEQVDFVKKYGNKVYYGDASRLDLLRAAKADKATIFVLAIDDPAASLRTAETVVKNFPHLTIFARARNRKHAYQLMDLGVKYINRETFLSSLDVARSVLMSLGSSGAESDRAVETFREHDERRLWAHRDVHQDEQRMVALAKAWAKELEDIFEEDARQERDRAAAG